MNLDEFEKKGLKIDKERILTYSQLSCPLECNYCFVENLNTNQRKSAAYLDEEQLKLLEKLPEQIKLIMLGCDTEFFQNKKEAIQILEKLAVFKKDISVITKYNLDEEYIKKLKQIDNKLNQSNNFLTFSISTPCLDNYQKWELRAPSPIKRIKTLILAN